MSKVSQHDAQQSLLGWRTIARRFLLDPFRHLCFVCQGLKSWLPALRMQLQRMSEAGPVKVAGAICAVRSVKTVFRIGRPPERLYATWGT